MLRVTRAGAVVMPAAPGFYHRPAAVDDLVDFVVARVLDHLDVGTRRAPLGRRWSGCVIGLISDTHGLLRADVHDAFAGVELILHAGDVGRDDILDELDADRAGDARCTATPTAWTCAPAARRSPGRTRWLQHRGDTR